MIGNSRDQKWLHMLTTVTESAIKEGDQHALHFYWKIISGICKRVKITAECELSEIQQHDAILCRLGPMYNEVRKPDPQRRCAFQEINIYLSMADALIKSLSNLAKQIERNEMNYDQLRYYLDYHAIVSEVANKFGMKTGIVVRKSIVEFKIKEFHHFHGVLSELLVQFLNNNW